VVVPNYPENQMLSRGCLEMAVRVGVRTLKEIHMQDRKCSKCGSANVYKNVGNEWLHGGVVIQTMGENRFNDLFQMNAFLCLDCHNLDFDVSETTTMYGKQKTLDESIQSSRNWIKVS
jgi:hypothetical protein